MRWLATAAFLLGLLWLQVAMGPFGFFGWDWSLCGLLVLCLQMRSPAYQFSAIGLGLIRDTFSVVPLGAQALGLTVTVVAVHFLGSLVLLENFLIQGVVFFAGYLFYQIAFFGIGKVFGFLNSGFWDVFIAAIPKAIGAAIFCWFLTRMLPRVLRNRSEI